jgi:hypothetical protein
MRKKYTKFVRNLNKFIERCAGHCGGGGGGGSGHCS